MQREQERELRRVRDRQRRQSMTVEQRERHLARCRRNYQLRRLRVENAKAGDFPSHVQQISNEREAAASGGNNDVWEVTQLEKTTAERLQHSECKCVCITALSFRMFKVIGDSKVCHVA